MDSRLERELTRRAARGHYPTTIRAMNETLQAIGYRLNRALDCASDNRYMTGEYAGESYPAINTGVCEADSGLSFANVDARRDSNFRTLQHIRHAESLFAVTRGRILEI